MESFGKPEKIPEALVQGSVSTLGSVSAARPAATIMTG